jgi:hypothetical protein
MLLEAVAAIFSASQLTEKIIPAKLGDGILRALDGASPTPQADRTGENLLLTGLATLLSGRYEAAAPLLREAIAALAATPTSRDRVPVWLMAVTFAATAMLYGGWLRRHQHPTDARDHLEKALALFTSMGAVPFASRAHLKKVFRKLGIDSRRQLRDKLS